MAAADEALIGFVRVLRKAGLGVTTADTATFIDAVGYIDFARPREVYWAGRAVLCRNHDDIPIYDYAFQSWFSSTPAPTAKQVKPTITTGYEAGISGNGSGEDLTQGVLASNVEVLRNRDVATLNAAEARIIAKQFDSLPLPKPLRKVRRREPAYRGQIDRARTIRQSRRRGGEVGPLQYAKRRVKRRRIIFFIDISGSMKPYADSLLRLAHHVYQEAPTTEVFAIGTRLTRITSAMAHPFQHDALSEAGDRIADWAGGTRLADNLQEFLKEWGRKGVARGAIAVIASDGWERGDTGELGIQMRALRGLTSRVIWSNPHAGKEGYQPIQGGIAAALPHIDTLLAGHSLAAFERLLLAIEEPLRGEVTTKRRQV